MKANDLLDMIGNVDDNIIEEAKQKKKAMDQMVSNCRMSVPYIRRCVQYTV